MTYIIERRMENGNSPQRNDLEARRERRELLQEIAQVQTLTASIAERMKRLRLLEEDVELASTIVSSITARMRKLEDDGNMT